MSDFESLFLPLCLAVGLLWLLMLLLAVGGRALSRWRRQDITTAHRVLRDLQFQGAVTAAQRESVQQLLRRLSPRVLGRVAADASLPAGAAAMFSAHVLARRKEGNLLRDATRRRRGLNKWRRLSALRVLAHSFGEGSFDERIFGLLREAVHDADRDIADGAVVISGAMRDQRAAQVLVEALRNGTGSPSRVAAQLDRFPDDISELLLPLLRDPNPATRRWAATLLSRYNRRDEVFSRLIELESDSDADVRSAVISSLGLLASPPEHTKREVHIPREELQRRSELVAQVARNLLRDEVWFVRAQAARTLGALGRSESAGAVTPLLGDSQWWVRQAAKDALQMMGSEVAPQVIEALDSSDRFARNGAAEVLQNLGLIDVVVQRMAQETDTTGADARLLQKIHRAGGERLLGAALRDVPEFRQVELWRLLRKSSATQDEDNEVPLNALRT